MSDTLARILDATRAAVAETRVAVPLATLEAEARLQVPPRGFAAALSRAAETGYGLIAEIKRASPSKGVIRTDLATEDVARAYRAGGATCLSVLTEGRYFLGDPAHLHQARLAVDLPILRKDFIIDPYQVVETRAMGADAILLILAALPDEGLARELRALARGWGLDVLAEVHDAAELERALNLEPELIGINNRNLRSLAVDLGVSEALAARVPPGTPLVAESGLARAADLARLARVGVRRFLVGESLMRAADITAATRALLAEPLPNLPPPGRLTHLDAAGTARMVEVGEKPLTARTATARARVRMAPATLALVLAGDAPKGDVLGTARLAGIMAAKRTADLIPLCHPLPLTSVTVDLDAEPGAPGVLAVRATARTRGQTGVEMEALTACALAALTVYDMVKGVERGVTITDLELVEKSGGGSGTWRRDADAPELDA